MSLKFNKLYSSKNSEIATSKNRNHPGLVLKYVQRVV